MTVIEEALFNRLYADADILAIVQDRIYPVVMPDDPVLPCLTYQRVSAVREHLMDGRGNLTDAEFTIDVWAYEDDNGIARVSELATKVRSCIDGFRGTLSGVDVQAILSLNETDLYESEVRAYRRTMRFRVIFRE